MCCWLWGLSEMEYGIYACLLFLNTTQEGDVLLSVNDVTVVNLHFADVLSVLTISSRPIRLRFRTKFPRRRLSSALHLYTGSSDAGIASSPSLLESNTRVAVSLDAFLMPEEPHEDDDDSGEGDNGNEDDDADSHHAVHSESFGDADSTRTTENSSIVTDITELEYKASRHSSRFTAFLRKPFRRADGFEHGRMELRLGIIPAPPRLEIAPESPSKVK